MADYKQMYLTLLDATEKAINELISAQRNKINCRAILHGTFFILCYLLFIL